MEAITPFPHGRLRGRRDAVAVSDKKQPLPGWPRPCGFDGRERPMARPVAHDPGRAWGPRTTGRWCGPLRADTQPATPSLRGPKERPQTRKLTTGGCRGRLDTPRRSPRPSRRGGCQAPQCLRAVSRGLVTFTGLLSSLPENGLPVRIRQTASSYSLCAMRGC